LDDEAGAILGDKEAITGVVTEEDITTEGDKLEAETELCTESGLLELNEPE